MKKLKSVLAIVLIGAMLMGIMSLLFGCFGDDGTVPRYGDPWKYKKEDQGFYYAVYSNEGVKTATILGLVDEELERDELVIPEKLGGYKVDMIGAVYQQLAVSNKYYGINAHKIKSIKMNIFIQHAFLNVFEDFKGTLVLNFNIELLAGFNYDTTSFREYGKYIKFDTLGEREKVFFMYVQEGNKIQPPAQPTKEGYLFNGWYKDLEYQTEWNFAEDTVKENITLYAKWLAKEEK